MAKGKRKIKKSVKICGLILLAIVVAVIVLLAIKPDDKFVYNEHLDDVVFTISDMQSDAVINVTLNDMTYYIEQIEDKVNQMALKYNPNNPLEFWNVHYSAGMDSQFTSDIAKTMTEELCIYSCIMENEAKKKEIILDDNTVDSCKNEAVLIYQKLSNKVKEDTGISIESIIPLEERKELTRLYVASLLMSDNPLLNGVTLEDLDFEGTYYTSRIRSTYIIDRNEELWDQIKLGRITINNDK